MQIERIEEMRLSAGDEAGITALMARAFDTDFAGRSFFMQRHHVRLVIRGQGVIGHIAVGFRSVRQGKSLISAATLSEVATDPERRGEGLASALLRAAIAEARQSLAEFTLLFGESGLYAGHGFDPVQNRLRFVDMEGATTGVVRDQPGVHLMVLALTGRDWDAETPVDLLGHPF